jgi:hypothetical protein
MMIRKVKIIIKYQISDFLVVDKISMIRISLCLIIKSYKIKLVSLKFLVIKVFRIIIKVINWFFKIRYWIVNCKRLIKLLS